MANYQGIRTGQQIDDGVGSSAGTGTGLMVKLGTGQGVRRSLLGTLNRISIVNGSGVDGSPTVDIDTLNHLDFMQSSPSSLQEGRLKWNNSAKTLEVGVSSTLSTLLNQEQFLRAKAKENILKGQVVYISAISDSIPEVNLAKADTQTTSNSVGIAAENINNNAFGKVVFSGIIAGLNTNSFNVGDRLYVSHETFGSIINTYPPTPFCGISVGVVIKKDASDGTIFINSSRNLGLKFLCDVDRSGATATGQFPVWDNDDNYFKFRTLAGTTNRISIVQKDLSTGNPTIDIDTLNHLDFMESTPSEIQERRLRWNNTAKTLEIGINGSNILVGQEEFLRVKAKDNILKGQAVYVSGFSDNVPEVNLARSGSLTPTDVIGIAAQNISANEFGKVVFSGIISGLNTNSFDVSDGIYISHEVLGELTKNKPPHPIFTVSVGIVIKKDSTNGSILVNILTRQEEYLIVKGKQNILKGQAVYVSGFSDNVPEVNLARSGFLIPTDVIGIAVENINNNSFGKVVFSGIISGLNTNSFDVSDGIYISHENAGELTKNKPPLPIFTISVGIVIKKDSTNGSILVNASKVPGLKLLSDVDTSGTSTTGQFPVWDNDDNYFKFRSISGTANRILVTQKDSITGNPTINIGVLDHLDFMESTPSALQEGRIRWNNDAKTLEIGTNGGANILVGQEEFFRVRANENILKGQAIYVSGFSANAPEVNLAKADSQATSDSVGIAAQNINNSGFGKVVFSGIITGLNTNSFEIGDRLFISHETKGLITNVRPPPPFCNVSVGIVIKKDTSDGAVLVNTSRTPRLKFLCDVDTAGATATGQFPVWDNSYSYFKFTSNINDFLPKIASTGNSLGTTGTVNLDFSQLNSTYQKISITDNITFTASNISSGQKLILKIDNTSGQSRNITFPNEWNRTEPTYTSISNNSFMIIEIITFASDDVVISMKIKDN